MPICRLCHVEVPSLVKSHIYPKALNYPPGVSGDTLAIISRDSGVKKSASGIYERFLCEQCEQLFSGPEAHFIRFVHSLNDGQVAGYAPSGEMLGRVYSLKQADPAILRLYVNSLLLRAHLAQDEFFATVDIGHHYDRLRTLVLNRDPGDDQEFAFHLFRVNSVLGDAGYEPLRTRIDGINGYILGPPRIRIFVKVDRRPLSRALYDGCIRVGAPVTLIYKEIDSQEFQVMHELINPHHAQISRVLARNRVR